MVSLECNNITFSYENGTKSAAITDFNLSIDAGEWVAVIGPSGAGKTTILKLMKGLLQPQNGEIRVNTRILPPGEINQLTAAVFTNPENQIVSPVVAEDVAFGLENMGLAPETIRMRVEEALSWVGLSERARDFSHHLSGGEQQRLILAGALAQKKGCLLLDDPLSMVGSRNRLAMLRLLKSIHQRESCTMVHTTHSLEEALVTQRLVAIEGGRLLFDGCPNHFLLEKGLIEQLGLEVPAVVQLGETLAKRGLTEPDEITTLEQLLQLLTLAKHRKDNKTERLKE